MSYRYKKFPKPKRALLMKRVEIDEWTVNLHAIMTSCGWAKGLTKIEVEALRSLSLCSAISINNPTRSVTSVTVNCRPSVLRASVKGS